MLTPCKCPLAGHCPTHRRAHDPPEGRPMLVNGRDNLWRACREREGFYETFAKTAATSAISPAAVKVPPAPAKPRQDGSLCVHRKGWINDVEVKPCCGGTPSIVSLYGCKLHRKCADSPKLNGIRDCGTCGEFAAPPAAP